MIKIVPCRDLSINDLVQLASNNIPVAMTSHPGNASAYKLTLWACGVPEYLWDVTCSKADKNNWPRHILVDGQSVPLLEPATMREVDDKTSSEHRYVTAYLPSDVLSHNGSRCGRVHVKPMKTLFPSVVSSSSRLLLSEKEKVREMFEYLADTCAGEVFPRYVTREGVMVKREEYHVPKKDLVASFMNVLTELEDLLFSDYPMMTKGGACYAGPMVPLSHMIVQYWRTGETHRYDISGPDMIHYATTKGHQEQLSSMLDHLRKWDARMVPKNITVHMPMGTVARVGYVKDHHSEEVMKRRLLVSLNEDIGSERKKAVRLEAVDDETKWPSQISPAIEAYFSQHDLISLGKSVEVDDFWREMPLGKMAETLLLARNKLLFRK